ncbi:stage II sporulation protein SA [Pullulanibacillus pueri]|uniref:Stage II sporulation protein SA n=1 Tax=Pullulanibacillus pueri TaxID=1437324 RepID=A0A8J2ZZ61_9BACL|nr:type II toxin-antitoxin system SpoIISA family toxin [Pullulanibacillus pueri]MBM7683919.1 stage II sporulation protein SA [Pullulanibacillus pueri]GGH87941.1 stage II sporulation protein SA [Pullulanibacillus pueri]
METFFIIAMWLVFILLALYILFSWIRPNWIKNHNSTLRKTWYLLFILGCLIYISAEPQSVFSHWEEFLTIFIAFIIVDSMVFLNLYFSKIGGQQLDRTEQAVSLTQESLDETKRKMEMMSNVLNSFAFPEYNESEEEYVQDFEDFLNQYAAEESLVIDLLPYTTDEEQSQALEGTPEKKVQRLLQLRRTFYDSKDKLMLHPVRLYEKEYVARVTGLDQIKVTDVDAQVINIFLVVYSLIVKSKDNEGGGE